MNALEAAATFLFDQLRTDATLAPMVDAGPDSYGEGVYFGTIDEGAGQRSVVFDLVPESGANPQGMERQTTPFLATVAYDAPGTWPDWSAQKAIDGALQAQAATYEGYRVAAWWIADFMLPYDDDEGFPRRQIGAQYRLLVSHPLTGE
jgi:hypothetical protein